MNDTKKPNKNKCIQNKCIQNKMGTSTKIRIYAMAIYLLKVINESHRTRFVICSKLTKKTSEQSNWHEDIKKHLHHSDVSIPYFSISFLNFGKCCQMGLTGEIKVQTSKNYETCKERCKLPHINQTGQTMTWKETCIKFKKYKECRLWPNIYGIYWDFCSARAISL